MYVCNQDAANAAVAVEAISRRDKTGRVCVLVKVKHLPDNAGSHPVLISPDEPILQAVMREMEKDHKMEAGHHDRDPCKLYYNGFVVTEDETFVSLGVQMKDTVTLDICGRLLGGIQPGKRAAAVCNYKINCPCLASNNFTLFAYPARPVFNK